MVLSDNEIATLLICSDIGLNNNVRFIPCAAYNSFAQALFYEDKQPSDLFSMSGIEISNIYHKYKDSLFKRRQTDDFSTRIPELLKRRRKLILELSKLENLGIHVVTRANKSLYPKLIRHKFLKGDIPTPAVIYYAGNLNLLESDKILAVVGSRNLDGDRTAEQFTKLFIKKAIAEGYTVSSGGAKGIDSFAMQTAIEEKAKFITTVPDSLEDRIKDPIIRRSLINNEGLYMSLANPKAKFAAYQAMNRNKIIYASAKYSMVVSCTYKTKVDKSGKLVYLGGTWDGAIECFKKNLSRLLVRSNKELSPIGNKELLNSTDALEIENDCIHSQLTFSEILSNADLKPACIRNKTSDFTQLNLFE